MTLEKLAKTFAEHAKTFEKENEKRIQDFKKYFPEEPLPEWFNNSFNVAEALSLMCREILRRKIDD